MATINATPSGLGTEILDHRGHGHAYALRRLGPCVYQLFREDTGAVYTVALRGKLWVCDCPAWKFRGRADRKHHPGTCKHCVEVAAIHEVLSLIASPPREATPGDPDADDIEF